MMVGYVHFDPARTGPVAPRGECIEILRRERCLRIEVDDGPRRPRLKRLLADIASGDLLIAPSIATLALSMRDLLLIADRLRAKFCGLRVVAEGIDTSVPAVWPVLEGLIAYEMGKTPRPANGSAPGRGRPRKVTAAQLAAAERALSGGVRSAVVAHHLGIHPTTLMRALKRG